MNWDIKLLWSVFVTAVFLSVVFTGIGCVSADLWWLGLAFAALGIVWWSNNRQKTISENTPFLIFLGLAVYAGFSGVAGFWLLLGGLGALVAWDLDTFLRKLTAVSLIVGEKLMVKAHLQQLAIVVGLSIPLGLIALLFNINISYGVAFVFALLAIWGVGLLLGHVVKNSENNNF